MTFSVVPSDEPRSLRLEGELDMATAPQLLAAADPLVTQEGDLRLELEGLSFVDSTGLRAFATIASRLSRGRLVLVGPTNAVLRVLELTGLHEVSAIAVQTDGGSQA
jgi:anti-sigma B factor antagonist